MICPSSDPPLSPISPRTAIAATIRLAQTFVSPLVTSVRGGFSKGETLAEKPLTNRHFSATSPHHGPYGRPYLHLKPTFRPRPRRRTRGIPPLLVSRRIRPFRRRSPGRWTQNLPTLSWLTLEKICPFASTNSLTSQAQSARVRPAIIIRPARPASWGRAPSVSRPYSRSFRHHSSSHKQPPNSQKFVHHLPSHIPGTFTC